MMRSSIRRIACSVLVPLVVAGTGLIGRPAPVSANSYPGWTISHYMEWPFTTSQMWDWGCNFILYSGSSLNPNIVIILDFGAATASGSTHGANVWYATGHHYLSTSQIATYVEQFADGFYNCTIGYSLTLAVGVHTQAADVTSAHGAAWASMINTINSWIASAGDASEVSAGGAIDAEMSWAGPTAVRSWATSFSSHSTYYYYDFGDAAGCSYINYSAPPGLQCGTSPFYQDDLWYISWGASSAYGIPEIYSTTTQTLGDGTKTDHNAQSWEGIKRYGHYERSNTPLYAGSTTQYTVCNDGHHTCSGTGATQQNGWTYLHNVMNYYAPTQTQLDWSTDFMKGF